MWTSQDYLPEDISLTDENAGSVVVTVGIDKDGTKSYDISMGAIKVNNLANGLSLSYESADVLEIQNPRAGRYTGSI